MKLKPVCSKEANLNPVGYSFYCPGCDHAHVFMTAGSMTWEFNENLESPTFTPSLLNTAPNHVDPKKRVCHLNLTNGILHFHGDCSHDFVGKSVPLPDHRYY